MSTVNLRVLARAGWDGFRFRTELSLAPLVEFWTKDLADQPTTRGAVARLVRDQVAKAPELLAPIEDLSAVLRHRELLDLLMAAVFPAASWEQDLGAALVPFQLRSFYATPAFRALLMAPDGTLQGRVGADPATVLRIRQLFAYQLVLRQLYGVEAPVDVPLIFTVSDPVTGLDRHVKAAFDNRFLTVEPVGTLPSLPDELRARLVEGHLDPDELRRPLPPERFRMRGFTVFRAIDVTDQEVLSALKRDLIDRESIVSAPRFRGLQDKLRTLLRRSDLRFGLAALDDDRVLILNYGAEMEHACIFADSRHHRKADFEGSIYHTAVEGGRPVILRDLAERRSGSPIDAQILASGVRGLVVAPLHYQDRVIGTLELGSPHAGDLSDVHLPKLDEVLPLFAMAVQRSLEELNSRVQAVIKEQCTAIHPIVEWRFRRAVLEAIEREGATGPPDLGRIAFDEVYPLYALADIRGSSTHRARAIQADLLAQLTLAREVLGAAYGARRLPVLDELRFRTEGHLARIEKSLASGDELGVVSFLRSEIEPLFDRLQTLDAEVRARVEAYRSALDPRLGMIYDRRRRFEESVTRITETISGYLDQEEQAAQAMFPHYFEKQQTDGVDYQIYVGQALLEDGGFDPLFLKNLRLWQLLVACGVATRTHALRERLAVPLETTQLILVQHAPLSIRFRFDEKRFDVDGAYNVRYEIVKKRIDKAYVRGTEERVTQPGRIAIVYGHPSEAVEYRRYIEYLQGLGYLGPDLEELELEDLQGMDGLRALRVSVDLGRGPDERPGALAAALETAR